MGKEKNKIKEGWPKAGGTRIDQYGQKTSNRNQIKQGYYAYQVRATK
ncbi:hypothetical protein VCR4J2_80006 [Vibrio coralliirubri]|nr:hypothetical protein VCR4J2_80006 [Vibrio coralliirubri]